MNKPEDLAHLKIVSSPIITVNGDKIFFTLTSINMDKDRYETNIWLYDLSTNNYAPITKGPTDQSPEPDRRGEKLAFISRRDTESEKDRGNGIYMLDLKYSREPRLVAWFKGGVRRIEWSPDGKYLLAIINEGEPEEDVKHIDDMPVWFNGVGFVYNMSSHLIILDPDSGEYDKITSGKIFVRSASWSNNGRYIAYTLSKDRVNPYLSELHIYDLVEKKDRVLLENITTYFTPAWSPDDKYVALIFHRRERGFSTHYKVYLINTDTGEEKCITCSLDRNVLNTLNSDVRARSNTRELYWDRNYNLYFLVSEKGITHLMAYNPLSDQFIEVYGREGFVVDDYSVSFNGRIALLGMTPYEPRELYLYENNSLRKLSFFNKFYLSRIELGKVEKFVFKASDGAEIDAWIMYPSKTGDKIPWILYIHGGPKTSYGWSFIEEFHYLVSNGYAIVYGNPRGSDGYSEEFADIRGHYGERDYQDLLEIVDEALKRYNFLDPERIGVAGGSYGGFMTNWIITHTNRFKAAVTQRSISDWISMYGTTDIGHYFVEDQIRCTPWRNPETCLEKSPIKYIENAETPTLIIHSQEDYRCWLDQALMLYKALKLKGVDTKLVIFPGENHDLSRSGKPKHRMERLKEIKEWFDKYLKKKCEAKNY